MNGQSQNEAQGKEALQKDLIAGPQRRPTELNHSRMAVYYWYVRSYKSRSTHVNCHVRLNIRPAGLPIVI